MGKIRTTNRRSSQSEAMKKLFIPQFIANNGLIQTTCDKVGIKRQTYYEWIKTDPKFKEAVEDAIEKRLDWLEQRMNELIEKGDVQTTLFAVKCLLKKRGYVDKQEVEVTGNLNVNILNVDPIENTEIKD